MSSHETKDPKHAMMQFAQLRADAALPDMPACIMHTRLRAQHRNVTAIVNARVDSQVRDIVRASMKRLGLDELKAEERIRVSRSLRRRWTT